MDNAKELVALADEQYNRGSFGAARVNYLEAIEALETELTRSQASAIEAVRRVARERDEIELASIERCAKVCEQQAAFRAQCGAWVMKNEATECANLIRALSSPVEQGRKEHASDCGVGTFKCTCGVEP